jgi:hypothetical protein
MWNLKLMAAIGIATTISLAGTAWYAHSKGRQSGMREVQTLWIAERAAIREAQAEEMMKARQREEALQALIDRQRRAHREEVNRVAAEFSADLERLRDRPEARAGDSGVPEGAAAGVGCTGQGLAAGDASFLAGFAADAARAQAALNACVTAYNEVREQVNRR